MNKQQTALVRALLSMIGKPSAIPAFGNVTIEQNRLRFWIGSGDVEVLVSCDDIADTKGLRGVIPACILKRYLTRTKEVELSASTVKTGDNYITKVAIRPDNGTFSVASDDPAEQPLVFASFNDDKRVAELLAGGRAAIVAASASASTDTSRAHVNAVWLKDSTIRATDGHKLERREFHGYASKLVGIPLAVCKALAKINSDSTIVITHGRHGGSSDTYQLTMPTSGAVVRFSWRDSGANPPPMEEFERNAPKFEIHVPVNRDELKGLVKPFKSPSVSFWPDGAMVVHESGISDTTPDPLIASYLPNGVPTTDPVWILSKCNMPLPDGELMVAADHIHAKVGSLIVMGCRSHPHVKGEPERMDLPLSVQEQLALQWELAERISVKQKAHTHEIVELEAQIDAERAAIEALKDAGDWSNAAKKRELELTNLVQTVRRKLRGYELGFRQQSIRDPDGDGKTTISGHLDWSLVQCGRAGLTERFNGTFYGLHGLRHVRHEGDVLVIDERVGQIYRYRPNELEAAHQDGKQLMIGHAIDRANKPIEQAQPVPESTISPPPPAEDEAPDTIRDPECVPESGVRVTGEQKLVKYTPTFQERTKEIAQTLGVRKSVLYTIGLSRVGRATFEHIARSVNAARIVFLGDPKRYKSMLSSIDSRFVAVSTTNAAVDAIHDLMSQGAVILAGDPLAPTKDGRHDVAQRVFGAFGRWHLIPQKDEILEPYELQTSIDEDRNYECYALGEWLSEQEQKAA